MDKIRKLLIYLLFYALIFNTAYAINGDENFIGITPKNFTRKNIPSQIQLKTEHAHILPSGVIIPKNSTLDFKLLKVQKERRWHKSGFIIGKLESYTEENSKKTINVSNDNYYIYIKKFEPVIPKDAVILGIEITLTQGADFFAPGSSFGYYFIKGAIVKEYHHKWYKAGLLHFYNNSAFWFWFHGKPIELEENELVETKYIDELRADSLVYLSKKYDAKYEYKQTKKTRKDKLKASKKEFKSKYKILKSAYKKEKNAEITKQDLKNTKREFKELYKSDKKEVKHSNKISKYNCKIIRKDLKKEHNIVHKDLQDKAKIAKRELKANKKNVDRVQRKENKKYKKRVKKELKTEVKLLKASYVAKLKQEKKEKKLIKKEERLQRKLEKKELKQKRKEEKAKQKAAKKTSV